jgi:hypothetical protein
MKTKIVLLGIISLLSAAPALLAQDRIINSRPIEQTVKYQTALEIDISLGERALFPPGVKEKMKLTKAQKIEMKPIENDFANTSEQFQKENQQNIDAAKLANQQARASKNAAQIQAARKQLQDIWLGLKSAREAGINQIKPLLTPDQLVILMDEKNQWRENHADEANDPSAN